MAYQMVANFTGTGSSHDFLSKLISCQNVDPVRYSWSRYNFVGGRF